MEMEEKEVKESGSGLRRAFIVDSLTAAMCSYRGNRFLLVVLLLREARKTGTNPLGLVTFKHFYTFCFHALDFY